MPPPLPAMPLPAMLGSQEELKDKLYSSRGISRRMTSGDTLSREVHTSGSISMSSTPMISTWLETLSSSDDVAVQAEKVAGSTPAPSVPAETKATTAKEREKEGWLTYLSTWLLYRPSAAALADKNILQTNEVPPGTPPAPGKGRVFGVPLEELMERQRETHPTLQVPLLVARALEHLRKQNGAMSEGIFREAGSTMQMNQLRAKFEKGEPIDFSGELNINNVSNLLKAFLRELPEPLLTSDLYDRWVAVCQENEEESDALLWGLKDVLHQLPAVNRETVRQLVEYWALVLQYEHINRMNLVALATVVGPTLLFKAGAPMANIDIIHLVNRLTSLFIANHSWLFDVDQATTDQAHSHEESQPSEGNVPRAETPAEAEVAEDDDDGEASKGDWAYPFEDDDNPTNTKFNADGVLIGGTLTKLVERLTGEQGHDPFFVQSFLLTLHSFSSPDEVINLLIQRHAIPPRLRLGRSKDDWELFKLTVTSKIWFVVKTWVENYWYDFEGLDARQLRLTQFLTDKLATDPHFTKPAHKLLYTISRKATGQELAMVPVGEVPKPLKPPVLLKDFTDLHPTELARQMALAEFGLYRKIQPTECLDLSWSKRQENAPNVLELIRRFNLTSASVAARILREKELAQRVKVVNFFINVAVECQKMQNFNGMMEIRTFEGLSQKAKAVYEEFAAFTVANYKAYRDTVKCAEPPCLPYLGVYLGDLTFIEEGNVNEFVPDQGQEGRHCGVPIINFEKRRRVATVIMDLINFQKKPFAFEPLPKVRVFLEGTLAAAENEIGSDRSRAEDRLYQLSLECEPRSSASKIAPSDTAGAPSAGPSVLFTSSISSTIRGLFTEQSKNN